ncbi:hypothetical protein BsWGS_07344 [Bradybaena similaris]
MATLGNDCYFFCTSTCAKGPACPFRHVEAAKTCRIICQHWQMGGCLRPMCKFRHSDFVIQVDTSEVPCFWESQPAGCMKKNCPYKHSKPAPQEEKTAEGAVPQQADPSVGTTPSNEDVKPQNIVQPVVTSPATEPSVDLEKNNSPQRPPALQESEIQVNADKQKTESGDSKDSKGDNNKKLSVVVQEAKVKKNKIKVSPVSRIKQKSAAAVKKRIHKNIADSFTRASTVKAKKVRDQPRKSVKDRLGRAPVYQPRVPLSSEESESESGSESDDSIENIKVMSVEEILRQKALESMMKKRAKEEKAMRGDAPFVVIKEQKPLPAAERKTSSLSLDRETRTVRHGVQGLDRKSKTNTTTTRKVKRVASPVNSSSSSSSQEEQYDERKTMKQSSESSSDSSDSSSASSSDTDEDSTDDSEELDIRRVVVDLESEKAARKRAKESFLKKQKLNAINTQDNIRKRQLTQTLARQAKTIEVQKTGVREQRPKKRFVNVDYDSDDFACSRVQEPLKLHVRDRLGKSLHKSSSDARLLSRAEKFGSEGFPKSVVRSQVKPVRVLNVPKSSSSSGEESDPLTDVKVKTLEEIRTEKMKIMAQKNGQKVSTQGGDPDIQTPVSIKDRLGSPPKQMQRREVVHSEARHVVLLNGTECDDTKGVKPSDEPKKTRKRPWRSVRPKTHPSTVDSIAGDERTPVVSSPSPDRDDSDHHKDIHALDESPFERLRRRALMKKLQAEESKKLKISPLIEEEKAVDADDLEQPESCPMVEISPSGKPHKHKHSHKHKRVKTERQIYMPPAMKSAVSKPSLVVERILPKQVPMTAPATKVSPLKREPHPIAAAWAAGLTLSSKGIPVRRPEASLTPAANVESPLKREPHPMAAAWAAGLTLSSKGIPVRRPEASLTPAANVESPLKREPHPMAAAWAAGLTLSSKGIPVRRPEASLTPAANVEISARIKATEQPADRNMVVRSKESVSSSKMPDPPPESSVTIKSFAEIMAEKRKRRLEMQAQKAGTTDLSTVASVAASLSEPSVVFSSSASSLLPGNSYQLNTGISQSMGAQSTTPSIYRTDRLSDTARTVTLPADQATKRSLVTTAPNTSDTVVTSVFSRAPAVSSSSSSISQGLAKSVGEKVKLKSRKKNLGDKRKKVKKLSTKSHNLEQSSPSCVVTSEDRNMLSRTLHPDTSSLSQTVTSSSSNTSLLYGGSNKTAHPTDRPVSVSVIGTSSPQLPQKVTTTEKLGVAGNGNVPKLSTPDAKEGTYSSKQNVAAVKEDSALSRKNTRLSLEDEFNFFEDEDMVVEDINILDNIEPIDNLLQDIDDLLS